MKDINFTLIVIAWIVMLFALLTMQPYGLTIGDSMEPNYSDKCHILFFENSNNDNIEKNEVVMANLEYFHEGYYDIVKNYQKPNDSLNYLILENKNNENIRAIPAVLLNGENNFERIDNSTVKNHGFNQESITEAPNNYIRDMFIENPDKSVKIFHRVHDTVKINDEKHYILKGDNNYKIDTQLYTKDELNKLSFDINLCN